MDRPPESVTSKKSSGLAESFRGTNLTLASGISPRSRSCRFQKKNAGS